ncbi:uncharacterized protein LOC130544998 isoform X1 [Triplophysa rosa]|uniref:uncharacterized protein LOC130544998 isoform X1 n=1 Tax=Triplophysa rosa TaxID=992332 RepID=UPI002545CB8D|nr:uncharacterized protein LOC130544998 isoform X1 [Triplophysa rosa]
MPASARRDSRLFSQVSCVFFLGILSRPRSCFFQLLPLYFPRLPATDINEFFADMSLSKSATAPGTSSSRACPAACGALIAAKDSHEFCVVCLGLKHAEEALENPEHCSHCLVLPKKLLRRRLKVAATQCIELGLSDSDGGHGDGDAPPGASRGATSLHWADLPNPAFPEEDIFAGNLPFADEPAGSGDEDDAGLLGVSEDEEAIPLSGFYQANPPRPYPSPSSWTCANERPLALTFRGRLRRAPPTRRGMCMMGKCWVPRPARGNNSSPSCQRARST